MTKITITDTITGETVTCDRHDIATAITPWYPDAPPAIGDSIADLQRRMVAERHPDTDELCVHLGITWAHAQPLDLAQVAARVGVKYSTIRRYKARGMLPDPDLMLGQSPGWWPDTVDRWQASRPGSGRH